MNAATHSLRQIQNGPPSKQSFFVVVLDLHVDDMYWSIKLATPSQ